MSEAKLVRRLEKLERDNRRLKHVVLGAVVLLAALAGIYAAKPVPQVIAAHAFEVVDGSGSVRVKMAAQPDGAAFLLVNDERAHPRVEIGTSASGVTIIGIYSASGYRLAEMAASKSGQSTISACDARGRPRVVIAGNDSFGGSDLSLFDSDGHGRTQMTVSASGDPTILLSDPQGFSMGLGSTSTENQITGETQQRSAASIVMLGNDKAHHVIWQAP